MFVPCVGKHYFAISGTFFRDALGKISRAGFQILFHFFDLPPPRFQNPAIKFAIGSQATEKTKRQQKIS